MGMSRLKNPLEVYKLLPKSNCRQCGVPTCMAFAAAVIKGEKGLADCPQLGGDIIERFSGKIDKHITLEEQQERLLEQLRGEITKIDFPSAAQRLGASFSGGRLRIKCFGRNFYVDPRGSITSECHINSWITAPLLNYIVSGAGTSAAGEWVPFRELKNGTKWNPLYSHFCEEPLKQTADNHTGLFEDILYTFGGRPAAESFSADFSLVLHPLPKVPILFSYCGPEDGLESRLNIFFDVTVEDNLNIESVYLLGAGLATMFGKISARHGSSYRNQLSLP